MTQGEATKRLPVKPQRLIDMNDFRHGLGASHDEALTFMLRLLMKPGETPMEAGARLRQQFQEAQVSEGEPADRVTPAGELLELLNPNF